MNDKIKPDKRTVIISTAMLAVSVVLFSWLGVQIWQLNKLSRLAGEAELTMQITEQLAEQKEEQQAAELEAAVIETSAPETTPEAEQPAPTEETITFR